jgi:DNA-binding Xre family transcriptional regulator
MRVCEKIRDYLKKNDLQPDAIAQKANIPPATFDALLNGRKKMYADDLEAVCLALDVAPETFVEYKSA